MSRKSYWSRDPFEVSAVAEAHHYLNTRKSFLKLCHVSLKHPV
jgi:hypothetical protein